MALLKSQAPAIHFKPIMRIDPAESKAAQIARRGSGLTVKFPRIDFDNPPTWPPLPHDEVESSEGDDFEQANDQEKSNAEGYLSNSAMHLPLNDVQTRARIRKTLAARETPLRPTLKYFDPFEPTLRKSSVTTSCVPRSFSSNPLQIHPRRIDPLAGPTRSPSVLTSAEPNDTFYTERLGVGVEHGPPRNKTTVLTAGRHASRFHSRVASRFLGSARRCQSKPFRGNSHVGLTDDDDGISDAGEIASIRDANKAPPARKEPSLSSTTKEYLSPIPSSINEALQAHKAIEGSHSAAVQSTFKMAMALSKPWQPGSHVSNCQVIVVSGNSAHQGIHIIPSVHPGAHSGSGGASEASIVGHEEPLLGRDSHRGLPAPINLDIRQSLSSNDGLPSLLGAEASFDRNSISATPPGVARNHASHTNDDPVSNGNEPLMSELDGDTKEEHNGIANFGGLSGFRQQQRNQPRTNIPTNRLDRAAAPGVCQRARWNNQTLHRDVPRIEPYNLTSENIASREREYDEIWRAGAKPLPHEETNEAAPSSSNATTLKPGASL